MHVAFRVDASLVIGTGHVMRCLTLADELTRQGHQCWFICRAHSGHLGDVIISKGYSLTMLPAPTDTPPQQKNSESEDYARWLGLSWQEDANQTMAAILPLNADWLVVDHYALDLSWERTLSNAVGKIMVIDDLANRSHECALLLDQNLGRVAEDYDGLLPLECRRLVGPRYALLRPEFAVFRKQSLMRRKPPKLKRILISLGGVDCTNATGQVLTALADSSLPVNTELDVIMGASAPYLDEVRKQVAELPFTATVNVNVQDMAERMCLADISIGAVGSTSWERCCLGLPAILLVLAENQKSAAVALNNSGAVIITDSGMGVRTELESLMYSHTTENRLRGMIQQGAAMVRGDGCKKVVNKLTAGSRAL